MITQTQSDDTNENIMGLEPLGDKWKSFNWEVYEIDGHNFDEIHLSIKSRNSNQIKTNHLPYSQRKGCLIYGKYPPMAWKQLH